MSLGGSPRPGHPNLPLLPIRFPFYYELKMAFVLWLLSPYTRGASLLYRKFVHPTLSSKEKVRSCFALPLAGLPGDLGGLPAC